MSETMVTSAAFYKYLGDHKLMGTQCRTGGELYWPPRPFCPRNHGEEMEWVELSGQGKLVAFTLVYIGTAAMIAAGYDRKNPYCVGIVELNEGVKISAQILGVDALHPENIKLGLPLRATFVERGEGEGKRTFLAFEPVR